MVATGRELGHPHIRQYADRSLADLQHQLVVTAKHWSETWPGDWMPNAADALLLAVSRCEIPDDVRHWILGGVPSEADLADPVARHLESEHNLRVKYEVNIGSRRADLVAFERPFISRKMIAVELKNRHESCEWLPGQVKAYRLATDETWVVMTPQCKIEIVAAEDAMLDPSVIPARLQRLGAALVIYDATDKSFHRVVEGQGSYDPNQYDELWTRLSNVPEGAVA